MQLEARASLRARVFCAAERAVRFGARKAEDGQLNTKNQPLGLELRDGVPRILFPDRIGARSSILIRGPGRRHRFLQRKKK